MLTIRQELKAYILGILIWIPLGHFLFPLLLTFYMASRIVHLFAKLFHPELIPISKSDALTAFAPSCTSHSYMYTCQIWRVKGLLDVTALRNHFQQCFLSTEEDRLKYFNLYCHFVQYLGYTFKKKVRQIDLNWHIHEHLLEQGDSLDGFIGKWMVSHDTLPGSMSGDMERPTWMIKLIPNEASKETTVLWKLHHGICDGYTILHLVGKLSGQTPPYMYKDPVPPILKRLKVLIQFPYLCMEPWLNLYKLKKDGKMIMQEPLKNVQEENWLISFCTLDLETVKGIRRVTGTNFVSVLMSIQIGALRSFLKEINPNSNVLKQVPLDTVLGHSMGWPKHPVPTNGGGMANHLTLNQVKASFHMEDPLERLLDLDRNFLETKAKGLPIVSYYFIFNVMKHAPAWFSRQLINADLSIAAVETGLSTLLGSSNKHYLLGHPVENIWLPVLIPSLMPRMKLMTVPVSHSGMLDISVNAGAALVKNQEQLDRLTKVHFQQELEALRIRCQQLVE